MEADRCTWLDSDKLDRCRRAHAQRHVVKADSVDSKSRQKDNNGKICELLENGDSCGNHQKKGKAWTLPSSLGCN